MSFEAESRKIGDMDWVVGGVDIIGAARMDTTLALLEDTVIAVPDVSILTTLHNYIADCTKPADIRSTIATLAAALTEAAHVAQSTAQQDWRKVKSVDEFQAMAEAAGLRLTKNGHGLKLVFDLISKSQMGDKFVGDWSRTRLTSLPVWDALLQACSMSVNTSLADDLNGLREFVEVRMTLSLLTRWQSVAARFSSSIGPQDMLQRASVLSRLATLFHLMRVAPTVAEVVAMHHLIISPILERSVLIKFNEEEGLKRIASRVEQARAIDINDTTLFVTQAFADPLKAEHLGNPVTVTRLPLGLWREVLNQPIIKAAVQGIEDESYSPISGVASVTEISASTKVWPLLKANALLSLDAWETAVTTLRDVVWPRLNNRLDMLEQDVNLIYARRNASQTKEAIDILKPTGHTINPFVPSSSPDLTPAVFGISKAEIDISSVGDLMRTALLPDTVEGADGTTFDARDLARYLRGRAANLRPRLSELTSAPSGPPGKNRGIADRVILHLPLSKANMFWPAVIPLHLIELCPPAYAGAAAVRTFVQDAEGLAAVNDQSLVRFRETMEANLEQGNEHPGNQIAVLYALFRVGVVTNHKRRPIQAELLATLNTLRANVKPTCAAIDFDAALTAGATMKCVPGHDHAWGIRIPVALSMLLAKTNEPIDLTGDGRWLLWPYTAMPLPYDITRFNNRRTPVYSRPPAVRPEMESALPIEPLAEELLIIDTPEEAISCQWLKNSGWSRINGRDMRTLLVASYPSGVYAGSPYVIGFRSTVDALRLRLIPQRVDIADALLWATETMYSAERSVTLRGRPTAKVITLPDTAYTTFISSIYGEAREL